MKYKLAASGVHRAVEVADGLIVSSRHFIEIADADLEKVQAAVDSLGLKIVSEEDSDQPTESASSDGSAEASGGSTATPNPAAASASPTTSPAHASQESGAPEGGK